MYWFKDLKIELQIYVYQYVINKRKEAAGRDEESKYSCWNFRF